MLSNEQIGKNNKILSFSQYLHIFCWHPCKQKGRPRFFIRSGEKNLGIFLTFWGSRELFVLLCLKPSLAQNFYSQNEFNSLFFAKIYFAHLRWWWRFFTLEKWEVGFKWTCTSRWIGQNHDSIENFYKTSICPASSSHPTQIRFLHRKKLNRVGFQFKIVTKVLLFVMFIFQIIQECQIRFCHQCKLSTKLLTKKQHLNVTLIDSLTANRVFKRERFFYCSIKVHLSMSYLQP